MRKLLFAAASVAALVAAIPASAQAPFSGEMGYGGNDPRYGSYGYSNTPYGAGGANGAAAWWSYRPGGSAYGSYGGPYGSYGGPYAYPGASAYGSPYAYPGAGAYGAYAYGADCPRVRQRIVTPSGRVVYRMRDAC